MSGTIQIEKHFNASQASPLKTIVGMDLGTTHSLVAIVENSSPRILPTREGHDLLPSIVSLASDDAERVTGYAARARRSHASNRTHTLASVKRLMGRTIAELPADSRFPFRIRDGKGGIEVELGGTFYSPVEVSSWILSELKKSAEAQLGFPVQNAVITVPAYFDDTQRQATRAAARLAGLRPIRILNEPTAAALAYGSGKAGKAQNERVAVYDLGGGTFDVSILQIQDGLFEVLSTRGDTQLGGDDLDRALAEVMVSEIRATFGAFDDTQWEQVLEHSEQVRKTLSGNGTQGAALPESVEVAIPMDCSTSASQTYRRVFRRDEVDALLRPWIERTRKICSDALADAGIAADQLDEVLMVGGTTRMPLVREVAESIFGKKPNTSLDPDRVVALGAAVQGDLLAGNNPDVLLLDVVPLTLGMETYGGVFHPLIPRNSKIPTVATEAFTTYVDKQTGVEIHVLQGERDLVAENRSLGKFTLKGIPPQPAGQPRIEVAFLVDADGILQVSAKDLATGNSQAVEIKPSLGLTDQVVETMVQESLDHAFKDLAARSGIEQINKAKSVYAHVQNHWKEAEQFWAENKFSPQEWDHLNAAYRKVGGILEASSHQAGDSPELDTAIKELNAASTRLAELLVTQALNG